MSFSFERLSSWTLSILFHLMIVVIFFILSLRPKFQKIDFEVLDYTQNQTKNLNLLPQNIKNEKKTDNPQRQVFGLSKKSILSAEKNASEALIKQGNTTAKAQDDLKLNDNDAESLPIPADDYLVNQMPSLESEYRIPYPEEARKNSIEGPVVMDLLIDQNGKVRKVDLISGPGHGLNEAALKAVENFKFRPAQMNQQNVAVRIRYTYRFVLENR